MYYFAMAGVDFLYFDMTNGFLYEDAMKVFLDTCLEMRTEGQMTPYLVPWCFATADGSCGGEGGDTGAFYELFMTQEKYKDLWFYWEGKPLALIKPLNDGTFPIMDDESFADKLTFRKSWITPQPLSKLYWSDNQIVNQGYGYGWSERSRYAECTGIGCAGFANFGGGRSGALSKKENLNAFWETDTMGEGLVFEDAFNQVMTKNPECQVLLISRWNEWVAQNFTDPADRNTDTGFVDQFNPEFSRDIEPMKGGFTDNYFYQMCSIIRRFKGVLPADGASGANTMTETDEDVFEKWETICPVYTDFEGDTSHRDHSDTTGKIQYVNTTGRNDILESRITADGGNLYFYVRTAEAMTSYTSSPNWMLLFIDADADKTTGWEGYDFLINYEVISDTVTTICAYKDGVWQESGTVAYAIKDDRMTVTIPRSLLGLIGENVKINFHWMDNVTDVYDLESWFTTGDSAPERRNNYAADLAIAYTGDGETILPVRDGDVIDGMPGLTFSEEFKSRLVEGLQMSFYFLPENYSAQPDFRLIDSLLYGVMPTNELTADILPRKNDIAAVYEGYILVNESCQYEFDLSYGDGAKLYIDGRLVVDGTYDKEAQAGNKTAKGSIILGRGYHSVRVEYIECTGGDPHLALKGEWKFYYATSENSNLTFTSDLPSYSVGTALNNTDLASFFNITLNFSNAGITSASYMLDGVSEMYTDRNSAYATTYHFTDGCEGSWYAFVRGTHSVVANGAPKPTISNFFETDGSAKDMGGAGIYARIEGGILKIMLKVYDDTSATHIKNVYYEIECSGNKLTLADDGNAVYVLVDDVTYAVIELSGEIVYDSFAQINPMTFFAETAKITLKDGRTDTLTNTLIDSDSFTQVGLATRAGKICFDSVEVKNFTDVVIPEMKIDS